MNGLALYICPGNMFDSPPGIYGMYREGNNSDLIIMIMKLMFSQTMTTGQAQDTAPPPPPPYATLTQHTIYKHSCLLGNMKLS